MNDYTGNIAITGLGVALPPNAKSQKNIVDFFTTHLSLTEREKRLLKKVYLSSGIEFRHSVVDDMSDIAKLYDSNTRERMDIYKKHALPLAAKAIENCFESSKEITRKDITHLITVSCTGMYAPGLDIDIVHHLGLPASTHRVCINFMGCYGVFNALKCAESICKANPHAKVLIVSVEFCTLHLQQLNSIDNLISSAIFSDGVGALLVEQNKNQNKGFTINDFYCDLIPRGSKDMTWDIGPNGFDIILSSYVPDLIESGISHFIEKLQTRTGIKFNEFQHYAIHPGGIKILEACEKALNLKSENLIPSYQVLKKCGTMSSATIIFVLKEIWDALTTKNQDEKIFSCAFGPGLTLESMLLTVNKGF